MNVWKIHLGWGLVAVVTAGAWGHWTATRNADDDIRHPSPAAATKDPTQARMNPIAPANNRSSTDRSRSTLRLLPDPSDRSPEQLRARLKGSNVQEAYEAVGLILNVKDAALKRELLTDCLRSSQPWIRHRAMSGLISVLGDDALPVIQGILRSDPEPFVQRQAAKLLGGLPDKGSAELLLEAYQTGDDRLKLAAATSLYRLGIPGPAAELLPGMTTDMDSSDGSVRKEAVERVGQLQAPIVSGRPKLTLTRHEV